VRGKGGFEISLTPLYERGGNTPSALTGRHPSERGEFSLYPTGERDRVMGNEHPVLSGHPSKRGE